ncbi:MAG TPA: hypothetical protein PK771_03305 [Spirochaetota bacterium]|nr:hypothetical protein [Spirochaetota bacterium]
MRKNDFLSRVGFYGFGWIIFIVGVVTSFFGIIINVFRRRA